MPYDPSRRVPNERHDRRDVRRAGVVVLLLAGAALGCGGGKPNANVADKAGEGAGRGGSGANGVVPVMASAAAAARMAPPPSAAIATALAKQDAAAISRVPAGAGHDLVLGRCLVCHSPALIEQQHKDAAGWDKTVTQMMAWGAPLSAAEKPALVAYLTEHFGARAEGPAARQAP